MELPTQINILGVEYSIEYVDNPADVDWRQREALWGQIDYWTRTIRVYANKRPVEDILQTIIHEILHGIAEALHLDALASDENHDELDIVALALTDVLIRNGWLAVQEVQR